jgi:hypothetical protein
MMAIVKTFAIDSLTRKRGKVDELTTEQRVQLGGARESERGIGGKREREREREKERERGRERDERDALFFNL